MALLRSGRWGRLDRSREGETCAVAGSGCWCCHSSVARRWPPIRRPPPRPRCRSRSSGPGCSSTASRDRRRRTRSSSSGETGSRASVAAVVPAGAKVIDLSGATVLPGLIDAHTHVFLQGEDPAEGGYDVQLLKYPLAYRAARATVAARRALEQGFTTIRDVETEGAGYGDVGIKRAIDEGIIPGPRMFVSTRAISTTGGYPLEGYAPEVDGPEGRAADRRPGGGAQGGARAAGQRRRLDQGLHDPPVLGGRSGQPGLPAHAHRGGAEGHRRRGARLGEEGRLPRLQRCGAEAGAGRRLRFHRARARPGRRRGGPDGQAGHVALRRPWRPTTSSGSRRARPAASGTGSASRCTGPRSVAR